MGERATPARPPAERLTVGLVRGLYGLAGMVRVEVLTERPEARFGVGRIVYREGDARRLTVAEARSSSPGWLVRFAEIADRTSAEALRGLYLEAPIEPGDELPPDAVYWHEVIGCPVTDPDGRLLGHVAEVYPGGGVEVYIVRGEPFGEFEVPAVRDFVRVFDPRAGRLVIDPDALELRPPRRRGKRDGSGGRAGSGGSETP